MKTADKIRFAIRHARFCFTGLGSSAHTNNILELFDIISELLNDRISIEYVQEILMPKYINNVVKREGLFPDVENTITIHQIFHLIKKLTQTGPLKQHWMFPFERLNHHIRGLVKNNSAPIASIVKNLRITESSVQFLSTNLDNMRRYYKSFYYIKKKIYIYIYI